MGESSSSFKGSQHQALNWPMGRILEVFPGSDGLVRVVNVKTSTARFKERLYGKVWYPIPRDTPHMKWNEEDVSNHDDIVS
ncbi:hypothetical protein TNCV_119381 [Trichonephila clavipes]|nr:hypothetical protein TNCV_119381 [Trichonephila clavipes]